MKKIFYFLPIVLLCVLVFTGCKKDGLETFTATFQRYNSGAKVYIDDSYYACWTNGDLVKINNTACTASVVYRNDSTLVRIPGVPSSESGYYAIYPASATSGAFSNGSTITLPAEQEYRVVGAGGNHQVIDAPMAAMANSDNVLMFQNLCFLLKVHIDSTNNKLQAIRVEAVDNTVNLSGTGTVSFDSDGNPSLSMTSGTNTVTLTMSTPVSLNVSGGVDFYIAIPALASGKQLNIITKDIFNSYKKVSITSSRAIPNNIILGVNGPVVPANDNYEFYDWIQSDSSGYLDLGVKPTLGAEMELTFSLPTYEGLRSSQYLCGSRSGTRTQWFTITGGGGQGGANVGYNVYFCGEVAANTPNNGGWARVQNEKQQISVISESYDGGVRAKAVFNNLTTGSQNELYTPKYSESVDWSTTPNVYLFAFNSTTSKHAGMRCYGFKYKNESGNLIHDFVPCQEKTGSRRVGVYDMVENIFIAPVQNGTRPFTVGND